MKFVLSVTALLLLSNSAYAEKIMLSKNQLFFEGNVKKTFDVVNLLPEKTAYFKTEVFEVQNPEKGLKSAVTPVEVGSTRSLIVTPSRSIIKPNEYRKTISVLNTMSNLKKERVFRILVTPVISGLKETKGVNIKLLVAYDLLVHVKPDNASFTYNTGYDDGKMYIENTGNTHFEISNGKACTSDATECEDLPLWYVYPGVKAHIPTTSTKYTEISYRVGMRGEEPRNLELSMGK